MTAEELKRTSDLLAVVVKKLSTTARINLLNTLPEQAKKQAKKEYGTGKLSDVLAIHAYWCQMDIELSQRIKW